jgi:DNA primase
VIPPEIIEQIRDAADIVQLIGEHVELKRTGSDWRGPCPLHGGTSRNFSVVPRKQMYHCFVCHESGDIFTFFMKKFGLDYPAAVREIAGRVGVTVPENRQAGPDPNEPLYSALGVAAEWFARRLRESDDGRLAREYLASRGMDDDVRDTFALGYAPQGHAALLDSLRALGLEDATLVDAGLALRREDGSVAARFRGRLLFPINDVRGRVVGFGGRILGDGEPKYLNSPESSVFHKGTLLYLLDRARTAIRTDEMAIVVEGYVDAIRLHAAGIGCAVAPLGTALTAEQAKVLRRYTRQVVLSYDADAPGLRSTFRAGDELLRQGAMVQVLTMPAGEDPDTLVRQGGAPAYRALLAEAVDLFERKIQLLDRKNLFGSLQGRRRALDRLLPTIRAAADPITRELYIARAAERTGVSKSVIENEVNRTAGRHDGRTASEAVPGASDDPRRAAMPSGRHAVVPSAPQERDLVRIMLSAPAWVERAQREAPLNQIRHPVYHEIAAALCAGAGTPPSDELVSWWEELARPFDEGYNVEAVFSQAVEWLKDRPRRERIAAIDALIPLASAEAKDALAEEKAALVIRGDGRYWRRFRTEREAL